MKNKIKEASGMARICDVKIVSHWLSDMSRFGGHGLCKHKHEDKQPPDRL